MRKDLETSTQNLVWTGKYTIFNEKYKMGNEIGLSKI